MSCWCRGFSKSIFKACDGRVWGEGAGGGVVGAMYIAMVTLAGFRAGVVDFALDARYQSCEVRVRYG